MAMRLGLMLAMLICPLAWATVSALDDAGHAVTLPAPAQRIVSLAPHATELLYAAGAGARVVGVSDYSNYPPPATQLPSVGGATTLDLERILALKPDLIVVWGNGNSATQIARLRELGLPLFESQPHTFEAIASSLERLAHLAGSDARGQAAANGFRARYQRISATYRQRPIVTVFYQIWHDPLMTLNDAHMVSDVIRLCQGKNIFGALPQLAATIGIEAVLQANPEVILSGSSAQNSTLAHWQRFPTLTAVARDNVFSIDADLMTRAGPRILDGAETLCKQLDRARAKRITLHAGS